MHCSPSGYPRCLAVEPRNSRCERTQHQHRTAISPVPRLQQWRPPDESEEATSAAECRPTTTGHRGRKAGSCLSLWMTDQMYGWRKTKYFLSLYYAPMSCPFMLHR